MNLKELRQSCEKGLEPILEVVTPNNVIYVLLYAHNSVLRINFFIHKYFPGEDNYWSLLVVLSNFEHIEEGLGVITDGFKVFMPQE